MSSAEHTHWPNFMRIVLRLFSLARRNSPSRAMLKNGHTIAVYLTQSPSRFEWTGIVHSKPITILYTALRCSYQYNQLLKKSILVHDFPQLRAVDTVVCHLEVDDQRMCWDLVFTALLEDLPYGADLVRCRPTVDETGLITSHELLCFGWLTKEDNLG